MHQTVGGRTWATVRTGMVSVVAAWALSGCGGGGTKETNIDIPKPAPAPTGGAAATAQAQALLIGYQAGSDNNATTNMVAVDPSTGKVVWSQPTEDDAFAYEQVIDSTGVAQQIQSVRQLFYAYDGRIYGLKLTAAPNVQPYQISSVANACNIQRVLNSDPSGLNAWLIVTTAGADKKCNDTDGNGQPYNKQMLVHTSFGVADGGAPYPFDIAASTLAITNSQGVLAGIVGYHAETKQLGFINQKGETLPVKDGSISSPNGYYIYGRVPGSMTQAYVLVDKQILKLDWSEAPTLKVPTPDAPAVMVFSGDVGPALIAQQYLYVFDGGTLRRFDGQGTETPLSKPIRMAFTPRVASQTPDYIVVDQYGSDGNVSWYAITKKTGDAKLIYKGDAKSALSMRVATGNVVLLVTKTDLNKLTESITRFDLDKPGSKEELFGGEVRLIRPLMSLPVSQDFSSQAITHLVLCHAVDATTGTCPASQTFIYDVQANKQRPLASSTIASNEPVWSSFSFGITFGQRYLMTTWSESGNSTTSKLWMFDPNVEGSLTLVP
jgi:hypothetical protein